MVRSLDESDDRAAAPARRGGDRRRGEVRDRDRPGAGRARRRGIVPRGSPRSRRCASGCGRRSGIASPRCSTPLLTAAFAEERRRGATRRRGGRREHRHGAQLLLRHRDALLRPEPRLGARARGDRPGHHLRRDGRHQHGARRADDARRLHDLRRADADARTTRACRSCWRSPRRSSSPDWRASSSSARSSGSSTAGRSRRCWRPSASAWCCSSSCARSSRRTTARSRRRRG